MSKSLVVRQYRCQIRDQKPRKNFKFHSISNFIDFGNADLLTHLCLKNNSEFRIQYECIFKFRNPSNECKNMNL